MSVRVTAMPTTQAIDLHPGLAESWAALHATSPTTSSEEPHMPVIDRPTYICMDGETVLDGAPIEGERLIAVNGVTFNTDTGQDGLLIEAVATRVLRGDRFAEITVWIGGRMTSLTIAPDTNLVVDLSDLETAVMIRALCGGSPQG